jgi:hypothetical protein
LGHTSVAPPPPPEPPVGLAPPVPPLIPPFELPPELPPGLVPAPPVPLPPAPPLLLPVVPPVGRPAEPPTADPPPVAAPPVAPPEPPAPLPPEALEVPPAPPLMFPPRPAVLPPEPPGRPPPEPPLAVELWPPVARVCGALPDPQAVKNNPRTMQLVSCCALFMVRTLMEAEAARLRRRSFVLPCHAVGPRLAFRHGEPKAVRAAAHRFSEAWRRQLDRGRPSARAGQGGHRRPHARQLRLCGPAVGRPFALERDQLGLGAHDLVGLRGASSTCLPIFRRSSLASPGATVVCRHPRARMRSGQLARSGRRLIRGWRPPIGS